MRPSLTFPAPPLKFRTLSSPQSGFKPWRLSINPTLPESSTGVKHQVCIPPVSAQFDSAFVAPWPSCRHGWVSQTTQPRASVATTTAHGSLAPNGLCCPVPPRYSDPIRQSRRLPPLSQERWLYRRSLPDNLVWAVSETFPALGQYSFFACHHPYAERRCEAPQSSPRYPWPSSTEHGVGSSTSPHTSCSEGFANDAAVFALCYGPQSCLPSWTGPTWRLPPAAEDFYTRACPRPVTRTPSRVSLHSPPGGELWPDFHRLECCRYRLHALSQSLRTLPWSEMLKHEKHY